MMQEWRQIFSRGLQIATIKSLSSPHLQLHMKVSDEGQEGDVCACFWVECLTSLARTFSHVSNLDMQTLPLVSTQLALTADCHQYITLPPLTLALPQMPALRTLRLSHRLNISSPFLLLEELPQALQQLPALSFHLSLTLLAGGVNESPFTEQVSLALHALGRLTSLVGIAFGTSSAWFIRGAELAEDIAAMTALSRASRWTLI